MLPTEQAKFFEIVNRAMSAYAKFPDKRELEGWWYECRGLTLDALESALQSHKDDADRGERAPKPADITRRMKTGARSAEGCAFADASGRCQYPGIFSDGTGGSDRWYCHWHRVDRSGPEALRWIEISRNVPYEEAQAKRVVRMNAEAQRAPAVMEVAHAIALKHGNRKWQGSLAAAIPERLKPNEDAEAA